MHLVPARFELPDPIEPTAIATPWPTGETDPVRQFLAQGARPWHREPVHLSALSVAALWTVVTADVVIGLWMGAVANGKVSCTSTLCSTSTLGGREVPLGLVALGCALALLVLSPVTSCLTRAGAPTLAFLGFICLASLGAALGVLAVLLLITSIFAVLAAVVLAVAGTA
jgi:hypothetical protein